MISAIWLASTTETPRQPGAYAAGSSTLEFKSAGYYTQTPQDATATDVSIAG